MKNILEVTGLNKSYGDFSLSDVTFSLQEDCITGFIGVNGAGKTTTIRSILRLTANTSGSIKAFGLDMTKRDTVHLSAEQRISRIRHNPISTGIIRRSAGACPYT